MRTRGFAMGRIRTVVSGTRHPASGQWLH